MSMCISIDISAALMFCTMSVRSYLHQLFLFLYILCPVNSIVEHREERDREAYKVNHSLSTNTSRLVFRVIHIDYH